MTPKEKAEELHYICSKEIYYGTLVYSDKTARKLALIAVNEILKDCEVERYRFWHEVEQEIIKL